MPVSASFPSGHAMSAFAVAAAIAVLSPRLRWPVVARRGRDRVLPRLPRRALLARRARRRGARERDRSVRWRSRSRRLARASGRLREQPAGSGHGDREEPDLPADDRADDDVEREVRAERDARDRDRREIGERRDPQHAAPWRTPRPRARSSRCRCPEGNDGMWAPVAVVASQRLGAERLLRPRPVDARAGRSRGPGRRTRRRAPWRAAPRRRSGARRVPTSTPSVAAAARSR